MAMKLYERYSRGRIEEGEGRGPRRAIKRTIKEEI